MAEIQLPQNCIQRIKNKLLIYSLYLGYIQNLLINDEALGEDSDDEQTQNVEAPISDEEGDEDDETYTLPIESDKDVTTDDDNSDSSSDSDEELKCLCSCMYDAEEGTYCGKTSRQIREILSCILVLLVCVLLLVSWFVMFFMNTQTRAFIANQLFGK